MNEIKKNVKWYLKDTNKEVCLGDKVTINQSITFSRYPDTQFTTTTTQPLDEEDIKSLKEAFIIQEVKEDYLDYIKWITRLLDIPYTKMMDSLTITRKISPNAALSLLLKIISIKINGSTLTNKSKVWLINISDKTSYIADVMDKSKLANLAWFKSKEDADYALEVCKPILESNETCKRL